LDDFGGHPNTVTAVFEVISALPWRRLHVVSGYRGTRGVPINRGMARALAIWAKRSGCESFFLTAAEETSDERNWAQPEERSAFQEELRREGVSFVAEDRMDRAIQQAVERVGEGDLLLILGTQGMDGAAAAAQLYWAEAPPPQCTTKRLFR
ncbi:MAG: glutamate ligase domain-containing protein, partial [Longimicrobiaceae bacterium]